MQGDVSPPVPPVSRATPKPAKAKPAHSTASLEHGTPMGTKATYMPKRGNEPMFYMGKQVGTKSVVSGVRKRVIAMRYCASCKAKTADSGGKCKQCNRAWDATKRDVFTGW